MTDSIAIPSPSNHSRSKGKQKAADMSTTPRSNESPLTPSCVNSALRMSTSGTTSTAGSPLYDTPSSVASASNDDKAPRLSMRDKGKMPLRPRHTVEASWSSDCNGSEQRASLLSEYMHLLHQKAHIPLTASPPGSSISKSEHTVVNIGEPDRPRLITCVKASQGFDWNQDIFLPSYISEHAYAADLERRQDPVEDIFITDEEAEMMFPR